MDTHTVIHILMTRLEQYGPRLYHMDGQDARPWLSIGKHYARWVTITAYSDHLYIRYNSGHIRYNRGAKILFSDPELLPKIDNIVGIWASNESHHRR